jgi:small conductance mechanosensitive channel
MDLTALINTWLPPTINVVVVFILTWIVARVAARFAANAPEAFRRQLIYFLPKVVWVVGGIVMLGSIGVNIGSLLALMATLGIGAALVFTPVGQNLIAGFLAGIDDVVRVGDVIEVAGKMGTVVRKGSLSVGVQFPSGAVVYVPNTRTVDDELVNHSRYEAARIEVEVKLDGSPDRPRAMEVMQRTLDGLEWRIQSKPVAVHFTEIGANAFHFRCYAWIEDRLQTPARESDMRTALADALEDAGFGLGETSNLSAERFAVVPAQAVARP